MRHRYDLEYFFDEAIRPVDTTVRPVDNKGGNVLFVKVTNGLDEKFQNYM